MNKDSDSRIQKLKDNVYTCYINNRNCSDYKINTGCSNNTSGIRTKFLMTKCSLAKDSKCVKGANLDYSIYQKKHL